MNLARGFNRDDGSLYFNYQGANKPVGIIHFRNGLGTAEGCKIDVTDVLINGISVKSKLGI